MAVQPVPAATVVLVREGVPVGEPWQTYMVRRHVKSDFAADVYVWPGGKVDGGDRDPALVSMTEVHASAEKAGNGEEDWRATRMAAVRELFEEAGVLLARQADGEMLRITGADADRFDRYRRRLHAGDMTMLDLAEAENLRFALDALHPFSRWITPEPLPRRFDTWFYLALMPAHQMAIHDRVETSASVWIAPSEALRRYDEGAFPLVFATHKHLEVMARSASVQELVAEHASADLEPVTPRIVDDGDERRFLIPGDAGYESAG